MTDTPSERHESESRPESNRGSQADAEDSDGFRRWRETVLDALAGSDRARIEVYVRSLLPPPGAKESQTARIEELQSLVETTPVEAVSVSVWGERICLCETCTDLDTGTVIHDTVRDLESWGSEFDATARPFFERYRQRSSLTGHTYEGVVPPRVVVACYVDGRLRGVFPNRIDGVAYSVGDFCDAVGAARDADGTVDVIDAAE